jgi:hypothetical protein
MAIGCGDTRVVPKGPIVNLAGLLALASRWREPCHHAERDDYQGLFHAHLGQPLLGLFVGLGE